MSSLQPLSGGYGQILPGDADDISVASMTDFFGDLSGIEIWIRLISAIGLSNRIADNFPSVLVQAGFNLFLKDIFQFFGQHNLHAHILITAFERNASHDGGFSVLS